jgi:hypothetical protein
MTIFLSFENIKDDMMKKRILIVSISLIYVFIMICSGMITAYAYNGDEIRASKKIISVVYDDSGSMLGERWSYTDYAMQALIALLNEQDELYITFMSDPYTAVPMDTSDLLTTIKKIHDWSDYGETPGEALDTARQKIGSINESDTTAQFWLVIMTDGGISMTSTLQEKLNSYKNNIMSNGTALNVVYLGMGEAAKATEDIANNLHTFEADSDSEIISTLQEIANLVSGRLDADQVSQIDGKTISVSSKLPLYSISILSQKSNAQVISAKTAEEDLNIQRNLALDATNLIPNGFPIDTLYGNAAVINKQNSKGELQEIPAGTYTITFSSDVDINNMMVQVEPAIALKAEISRTGVVIDDTSKLGNGDKVDIKIIPIVPGTDDIIPDSDLPKQISWNIEYEVDGTIIDSGSGTSLTGVTLTHGSNVVRSIINIPGYAPFVNEIYFNIDEITYHFGIQKSQPSDLSYNRSDMKHLNLDDSNTIKFEITNDGKPLSKDEQKSIGVTLQIDDISISPYSDKNIIYTAGNVDVRCKLVQNDDGSYSLIPSCPAGVPILALEAGNYTVKVSVSMDDSITETGEFTVVPSAEDAKDIPKIVIGLLIFLYIFYLLFIKKKFKGQTVHYECWRIQDDGRGVLQKGMSSSESLGFFSGHFLLPMKACYVKYHGLKLVAESGGMVIVTGDSIAQTVVKYGTSTSKPEKHLRAIESHLHKTVKKDGQREASDQDLSSKPIYFKSSDSTRDIWRIWLTDN